MFKEKVHIVWLYSVKQTANTHVFGERENAL